MVLYPYNPSRHLKSNMAAMRNEVNHNIVITRQLLMIPTLFWCPMFLTLRNSSNMSVYISLSPQRGRNLFEGSLGKKGFSGQDRGFSEEQKEGSCGREGIPM